ncbi:MAG TPA: TIGR00300 family protein [Nitrospiria bacterium]|jgi:lysine-ketoglutarate reductase/saccharopine dehydrogenase-like protein (TIGR00300 family)|nr:TIGR00300 family protein [Nitrospiria bacterium]
MPSETVELQGHIIDSLTLPKVLDEVMNYGGTFEILDVAIGQRREDSSRARIQVSAPSREVLDRILGRIRQLGAVAVREEEVALVPADRDGAFPENFYCTTNLQTFVRFKGQWLEVARPEMDCGIRVDPGGRTAATIPMHRVENGDRIVVGHQGIKVIPLERSPERNVFEFMASSVSSEKPKAVVIREVAARIRAAKQAGEKVMVVAGPAVVHTGAGAHLERLIEEGWVDLLFAGNALAVHDIEQALYGTSLGVYLEKGIPAKEGHEHHLRAINTIRRAGSIRDAVERGILKSGIMAACVRKNIEMVLAGSIRDDGPLPEVMTDMVAAQDALRRLLPGVSVCVMIATMLHSIAAGNLLPASVKLVCVDINPAVVTKLTDRGSFQAIGLVTDVEPFLRELSANLSS